MRDTLKVNISHFENLCTEKITKRTILAAAHRIFDPLGFACPITLIPTLLLQHLWKGNISWDQEVDADTKKEFLKWMKDVPFLSKAEVPRSIKFGKVNDKHSLHVFCDASQFAYATAVFLCVEKENSVYTQLL
ncbi:uncharacterized protein LOC118180230 [Stegodyphus dumicola]|uniref:uncharacterized protein LOC118180230 n=1 Tax=Stegodyphus dumicola TaxID=202533 RepID=UPI0015AC9A39|nr:uncharacterized protein LOC118180230 [Stegodyphus dumicola]